MIGSIYFEPRNPHPINHQICYNATKDNCYALENNTFNGTGKDDFKFGTIYIFYICTTGIDNYTTKSNEEKVTIGLDQVKIPNNFPIFSSERIIYLSFDQSKYPEKNWDSISIICRNTQSVTRPCFQSIDYMNCTCESLTESTMYNVSVCTNKNGFKETEVSVGFAYTSIVF